MLKKKILTTILLSSLVLLVMPKTAHAMITNTSNSISDDFNDPLPSPNTSLPWDYWYLILDSADSQGFLREENLTGPINCNNAVCINQTNDGTNGFERMSLYPETYPGGFNVVQLSDQRDGFTYGVPHRWLPTVNHPVTMIARFRASSLYTADASGDAVGSFGFWLQNNPDELTAEGQADPARNDSFNSNANNIFAIGFNWADKNSVGGLFKGLKATMVDQSNITAPIFSSSVTNANINDWTTLKMVWSVNFLGIQTVTYYANDQLVGLQIPIIPLPSLSQVIWLDNEQPTLGGSGGITVTYVNPSQQQYMDVDSVSVTQP